MQIDVNGTTCYMQSQCREERTRGTKNEGLKALRYVTRDRFAWPGGYEMALVTADGGLLCSDCCRKEYGLIYRDTRDGVSCGWTAAAVLLTNELDPEYCSHCGRQFDI